MDRPEDRSPPEHRPTAAIETLAEAAPALSSPDAGTTLTEDPPPPPAAPLLDPPIINQIRPGESTMTVSGPADRPRQPALDKPPLSARPATIILLVFLGAQFGAGILVGMVGGIVVGVIHGIRHSKIPVTQEVAGMLPVLTMVGAMLGVVAGGIAMLLASTSLIRGRLNDCSPLGAAWDYGRLKDNAVGLGLGLAVGAGNLLLAAMFVGFGVQPTLGPLAKMANTQGLSQAVWILLALVFAPPIEELLFRGVLYGGYRRTFGAPIATALTTGIFVVLHLTETIHFPPATISIAGLAIVALWFRLRTAAIGPAVAVHFGYNLVAVTAVICSTWGK